MRAEEKIPADNNIGLAPSYTLFERNKVRNISFCIRLFRVFSIWQQYIDRHGLRIFRGAYDIFSCGFSCDNRGICIPRDNDEGIQNARLLMADGHILSAFCIYPF